MTPSLLHAADFSSLYGGNFIASLKALAKASERSGFRLVLVVPPQARERSWSREWADEGRGIYFVPPTPAVGPLRCAALLAKIAAGENAAIFHTHFTQYDVPAWLASVWLGMHGRRSEVVWHHHSDFPNKRTASRRIKDWLKYRVMGRSANVIGVSEQTVRSALVAGFPPASLRIIPNGVDVCRVTSPGRSRNEVAAPLHVDQGACVVLLFGWHPAIKGVDLAMDAVRRLAEEGKKVVLAAIGTQSMLDFIRERVGENIPTWLRTLAPAENVADLYQIADVFLSASRNEGFPYSVTEAMACGVPTVLSDIPAVAWAKQVPGTIFFPAGDSAKLADALREVLKWTRGQREEIVAVAQEFVRTHYDVRQWAEQIVQYYRELLGTTETIPTDDGQAVRE